jgi:hypothetical protein
MKGTKKKSLKKIMDKPSNPPKKDLKKALGIGKKARKTGKSYK